MADQKLLAIRHVPFLVEQFLLPILSKSWFFGTF